MWNSAKARQVLALITWLEQSEGFVEQASIVPGGDVGEVVGQGAHLQEVEQAGFSWNGQYHQQEQQHFCKVLLR